MNDYIVRATAANAQIRAFAATTKNLWSLQETHTGQARWQPLHSAGF